jgi:VanZ family protein
MSSSHKKWFHWLPVIALCMAIFLQSCFPSPDTGPRFPLKDKVLHMAAYGLLAALFARACRRTWPQRHTQLQLIFISVVFSSLYGLSDELHQSLVTARQAEFMDGVADFAGSLLGAVIYLRYRSRRKHPMQPEAGKNGPAV